MSNNKRQNSISLMFALTFTLIFAKLTLIKTYACAVRTRAVLPAMLRLPEGTSLLILLAVVFFISFIIFRIKKSAPAFSDLHPESTSNDMLIDTLYSIGNGLITTNNEHVITLMNPAAEEITGYTRMEAIGKPLSDIFRINNEAVNQTLQSVLITSQGTNRTISSSIREIKSDSNEIVGMVIVFEDISEKQLPRQAGTEEYQALDSSNYDILTGLPNRKYFYELISSVINGTADENKAFAILFIDLDLFKNVNDTLGHDIGDTLLQQAAERLDKAHGENVVAARMGGDEFAILLPGLKDREQAIDLALDLLQSVSSPFHIGENELYVSASIGIAIYPEHGNEMHMILKNAASAMYKVKELGRNNYHVYTSEINEKILQRFNVQKSLRRAIENQELLLHYQPKVDGQTGQLVGMEALVRWQHPERGLIYPIDFIPIAEETGLIKPLDEWVLRTACNQLKTWIEAGHSSLRLAVNLSAWQFKEQHLAETVAKVLEETGVEAACLELEITETVAMENLDFTINTLGKLMEMGVNISIDDFGTGYSSLNYLKHFPINFLKIDRSFVADIKDDKNTYAIVKAIIDVAHTLNLKVIAEGVETKEQLTLLQYMGCDEIQGYFISRPLPVAEAEKHMAVSK